MFLCIYVSVNGKTNVVKPVKVTGSLETVYNDKNADKKATSEATLDTSAATLESVFVVPSLKLKVIESITAIFSIKSLENIILSVMLIRRQHQRQHSIQVQLFH